MDITDDDRTAASNLETAWERPLYAAFGIGFLGLGALALKARKRSLSV